MLSIIIAHPVLSYVAVGMVTTILMFGLLNDDEFDKKDGTGVDNGLIIVTAAICLLIWWLVWIFILIYIIRIIKQWVLKKRYDRCECGKRIPIGDIHCYRCLPYPECQCGEALKPRAKFCPRCGQTVKTA